MLLSTKSYLTLKKFSVIYQQVQGFYGGGGIPLTSQPI